MKWFPETFRSRLALAIGAQGVVRQPMAVALHELHALQRVVQGATLLASRSTMAMATRWTRPRRRWWRT